MTYFQLATIEISLLGVLSGLAGTLIILRKRSFFAVALSHATFPGGVLFAILGFNLLLGQALFAVLLVLAMTALSRVPGQGKQVASGVILSFGFALGMLLSGLNAGLGVPVEALLVGSPLSVSPADVWATAVVLAVTCGLLVVFRRRILFQTFDPVGFSSVGFRTWPVELVSTAIIAAAMVVAMPAVGAILGVAIIVAPAAAAQNFARRIEIVPALAAVFGVASGLIGLWASRVFDIAAGGAVGLVTTLIFVLSLWAKPLTDMLLRLTHTTKLEPTDRDAVKLDAVDEALQTVSQQPMTVSEKVQRT